MRIVQTNRANNEFKTHKTNRKSQNNGLFESLTEQVETDEEMVEVSQNGNISHIDNLLFLQEVDNQEQNKQEAIKRSNHMLDLLDDVKIDLLSGKISYAKLERLRQLVKDNNLHEKSFNNPQLKEIIELIELRSAVEIAKLEKYR